MKRFILLTIILNLTGCIFGQSNEVKRAEKILQSFECNNIVTNQIATSSITNFHQQTLAATSQKHQHMLSNTKMAKISLTYHSMK